MEMQSKSRVELRLKVKILYKMSNKAKDSGLVTQEKWADNAGPPYSSHVRARCTTESQRTGIGLTTLGPPSYLLCLFCSQFCLYSSVSLTKSSILRACHQKKMLSTVQMQVLLREERKLTFYLCVITLGYMQLN